MGVLCMRSKPYGDPSMGLRWPRSERYDAQGPPWLYPQKVQSRAVTLLGERPTGQKRTQRAASLILGQPPRRANSRAVARPMPRPAPVTMATCPSSSIYALLLFSTQELPQDGTFGSSHPDASAWSSTQSRPVMSM